MSLHGMTLVIFKVNQLGDNVVFLPVVQALSTALPGWRIVVLTSPVAAPLYQTCCPGVEVRLFETAAFNGAWRKPMLLAELAAEIRRLKPDACLLGDDQGSVAHLLMRISGASMSAGPRTERVRLNPLLNERVRPEVGEHVAMHNWRIAGSLLRGLGLPELSLPMPAPDLTAFGKEPHGAVLMHAGASRPYKHWPVGLYVELANRLCSTHEVVWMEQNCTEEQALLPEVRRVPAVTLNEFIRLMAGARHFVGNNSGPMNIASALGVPGTIFNGPSASNWDPPWHLNRFDLLRDPAVACQPCDHLTHPVNTCRNTEEPMACMNVWTVERVHERLMKRLAVQAEH